MTISYNWLLQYLPEPLGLEELCHILTSIGLEVEGTETIEAVKGGLKGLVIGEVLTCEPHPNADKLKITTVNTGGPEPLQIVCGASNVAAGQKVVVATVGTTIHPTEGASFQIKKAKIRSVDSAGMICAEDEIGLGNSHEGIMVLDATAIPGTPAAEWFNIPAAETAVHIGLTPNRSDAMSHIGTARDVCAYLTHHKGRISQVVLPEIKAAIPSGTAQRITVQINADAAAACPRYAGVSITGVQVGPSPEWLKQALNTIGVRSINNIVDVTNYVLHEYGQPLHAFDAAAIDGQQIRVGFMPEGTPFTTLDDKERKLYAEDLMIMDAGKGLCMAGVFGGNTSGVTDQTTEIFLESAYFSAAYIRRSSLRHGLRTDAAVHFEKSVDISNVLPALQRAAVLITEVAGGTIASPVQDVYPVALPQISVTATYEYIRRLSGKDYSTATIKGILTALGFDIQAENEQELTVLVPSNKSDVSQPADLVEEVLRIDGLDQVAIPQRLNISLVRPMPNDRAQREQMAEALCGAGFQEIVTNSITNSKYYPGREDLVRMINSLTSELDVLRPSMLESGLEVLQYNINRRNQDLALFEFGTTYSSQGTGKYTETPCLALWVSGDARAAQWSGKAEAADLYYVKGVLSALLATAGIEQQVQVNAEQGQLSWKWKNQVLCTAMEVPAEQLKAFDVRQKVFYAVISWPLWHEAMKGVKVSYREVPKFPAVQRDLALVLNRSTSFEEVRKVTRQSQIAALQSFDLFDVFESEKLGADKKSYALNYTFQLNDRTLTDTEIEQFMQQLVQAYTDKLDAQIRS